MPEKAFGKAGKLFNCTEVTRACNRAILIAGSARSGTTILGKIIHSFKNVEYRFEPGMFFWLFPLLPTLSKDQWKLLYEAYLFEEILIQSLCGRTINTNRADESSIYNVKSEQEISRRLKKSLPQSQAAHSARAHRIAYKLPNVVPYLPILRRYYPYMDIVIAVRKAPEVLNSLLKKGWFSNRSLRQLTSTWPSRIKRNIWIPFWVRPEDESRWIRMDELHRAAYYYIISNRYIRAIPRAIVVRYDELIFNPKVTARRIAQRLGLAFGVKTPAILRSVKRTVKERDFAIINKLEPRLRREVLFYSRQS